MTKRLKIIFFGTPEFAKSSLAKLFESGFNIVAVVTSPDKPAGRGQKLKSSEVKDYAIAKGIPILQPTNMKDEGFVNAIRCLGADLHIVVAFRMLPEVIWNMPPLGTVNLHASLLPQYRGAAPINHAIINGEKTTGVTTFKLKHEIDTGDIILRKEVGIDENENAGELHDKLMMIGAEVLKETVIMIENGTVKFISQDKIDDSELKKAPKIFKEHCQIDFNINGEEIINQIKGLSPYPTANFTIVIDNLESNIKVFDARFIPSDTNLKIGEIESDWTSFLSIRVKNGKINMLEIQMSGKKRLKIAEFLRGFNKSKHISIK